MAENLWVITNTSAWRQPNKRISTRTFSLSRGRICLHSCWKKPNAAPFLDASSFFCALESINTRCKVPSFWIPFARRSRISSYGLNGWLLHLQRRTGALGIQSRVVVPYLGLPIRGHQWRLSSSSSSWSRYILVMRQMLDSGNPFGPMCWPHGFPIIIKCGCWNCRHFQMANWLRGPYKWLKWVGLFHPAYAPCPSLFF